MLHFKTKYINIITDGVFVISRGGKNQLHKEFSLVQLTDWKVEKDLIFLKVGAYSIIVKVKNSEPILELIREHLSNPIDFIEGCTVIHCKSITIKEN